MTESADQLFFLAELCAGIAVLLATAAALMETRNGWVLEHRLSLIHRDLDLAKALPDYDVMMRQFWIWRFSVYERQAAIKLGRIPV